MKMTFSLLLAFLWSAGQLATAQVNLLPQGSFENPSVNTGWAEGFNTPNNLEFRIVSESRKRWLRIENRDPTRQLDYVHAYVKVTPEIASLTVSARLRATNLKIGTEGWHTACVALMFEGGNFGFPPVVPELRADSDWVTKSVELKVPKGATRLNIQPALFRCTGVFEVADLTVTPRLAAQTQLADAVLPSGISLGWDKTQVVTLNAKRAQVSLDGVWRFIPAAALGAGLPTSPKPPTGGLPDSRDLPVGSRAGSGDPRTAGDPNRFQADQKTYFRYTRWRSTRAVAQLLANLGATFPVDSLLFHPLEGDNALPILDQPGPQAWGPRPSGNAKPRGAKVPQHYHPDYISEFPMGDNPYRYYRW